MLIEIAANSFVSLALQRKIALLAKLEDETTKGSINLTLKNVTNQLNNSKQPPHDTEPVVSNSEMNTTAKTNSESSTSNKSEIDTNENNANNEQPVGHNNLIVASNENTGAAIQQPLRESNSSDSINTITKTHRKQHSMSDESFQQQQLERNAPNSSSGHRRAIKKTRVRVFWVNIFFHFFLSEKNQKFSLNKWILFNV